MSLRRLIVVGSGEVADHLLRLADMLEYSEVMSAGEDLPSPLSTADDVVVALEDDAGARAVLREAAPQDLGYLGLVAKEPVAVQALSALSRDGVPQERLDRISVPAGVNIGAETPAEIAIAVAAELVARHRCGEAPVLGHGRNFGAGRRGGEPS
jgi:xanthine/CO dehydrogenase XdhC/CoxF family maturation factor